MPVELERPEIDLELAVAKQAAARAGEVILLGYKRLHEVTRKPDQSFVSEIDRASEEVIVRMLRQHFPNHRVLTEETDGELGPASSEYLWVVDPLDGTANYLDHFPHFGVSIALLFQGEPIVAVVYDPLQGNMFTASATQRSRLNDWDICCSPQDQLRLATVAYSRGHGQEAKERMGEFLGKLVPRVGSHPNVRSAALQLAYVATGQYHASVSLENPLWDVAAGVLLVRRAYGAVTDGQGRPWTPQSTDLIASNCTAIHQDLVALVSASSVDSIR